MLLIDVSIPHHQRLGFDSVGSKTRIRVKPAGVLLSSRNGEVNAAQTRYRCGPPQSLIEQCSTYAAAAVRRRDKHSPDSTPMTPLQSQFSIESDHPNQF